MSTSQPGPARSPRRRRLLVLSLGGALLAVVFLLGAWKSPSACRVGAEGLRVTITADPSRAPACGEPDPCLDAYDAFFDHPATVAAATPPPDWEAWFMELLHLAGVGIRPPSFPLGTSSPVDPEAAILDGTHMRHLFEPAEFAGRPLEVVVRSEERRTSPTGAEYRQLELVFVDEFAGEFGALLLLPPGREPFPALVALPGHSESPADFRDQRFGRFYPERGYALLIIGLRAYSSEIDHQMTARFLQSGFSLALMRAYEGMLGLKFLQAAALACNSQLGMVSHSGGSVAANLALWLSANPAVAHVSDLQSDYLNVDWPPRVDCETHPALAELDITINDFPSAPRPVVEVFYNFVPEHIEEPDLTDPAALDAVVPFFDRVFGLR